MKKTTIIKKLTTVLVILSIIGISIYLYIPKYLEKKIETKALELGIEIKYSKLEYGWDNVILYNVEINKSKSHGVFNEIQVFHDNGSVNVIIAKDGSCTYQVEEPEQGIREKVEKPLNKEIIIVNSNVKIKDENKSIELKVKSAKYSNNNKNAYLSSIHITTEELEVFLGNIYVDMNSSIKIESGEVIIKATDFLQSYEQQTQKKNHRVENVNKLKQLPVNVSNLTVRYNEYSIKSDDFFIQLDRKEISAKKLELISGSDAIFSVTGFKLSRNDDSFNVSASELSTHKKEVSKDRLNIESIHVTTRISDGTIDSEIIVGKVKGKLLIDKSKKIIQGSIPSTNCNEIVESLPHSLKESLTDLRFEGSIEGEFNINISEPNAKLKVSQTCKSISHPINMSRNTLRSTFKRTIILSDKSEKEVVSGPNSPEWTSINSASKYLPIAIMACEDAGFYAHKGISIQAIENSIKENIKEKKFIRGGSTITMQTVKNLWLNRTKTIDRKIQEAFLTFHLESILSKDEIMETYFNIVEFSPGEYGIRKAANKYFGTSPSQLSLAQSIFISLMLPNPRQTPWDKDNKVSEGRMKLIRAIITNLKNKDKISPEEYQEAMDETLVLGRSGDRIQDEEVLIDKDWK
jgi:hypothetical protein